MFFIKKLLRKIQNFLEVKILSNQLEKFLWKFKHIYRWKWHEISINSYDLKHRHGLIEKILTFNEINKVLEIGCAAGPNLRLLRKNLPKATLVGIDINKKCVSAGNNYFQSVNDLNSHLYAKSTDSINFFPDNSFDICFTQGCLLLLPPNKIYQALSDIIKLSRKGMILQEFNKEGATAGFFDEGRWVYDYKYLINKISSKAKIEMYKSSFEVGSWVNYGRIIKVELF